MKDKNRIVNDPVLGFITIPSGLITQVVQHPFVQRLNRIRQLGLSHVVYPGAMHTRFLHSIGAMHLMTEAVHVLRDKGIEISHRESEAVRAAILLHDVGHGPFSHVLEHTMVEGITHEEISLLMMEQINHDICRADADLQTTIEGTIEGPLDLAIQIFKDEYPRHFLHQLISSQLDVDRLDYLCRDSFFCGVSEGTVASARILKTLNVAEDRLVVESKGIYSIEKFLVARRLMYWQVYLHKTSVGAEQLLIKILSRAKEISKQGNELFCSPALHYFLYNRVSAEDFFLGSEAMTQYAMLDDSDIMSAIKVWGSSKDIVLSTLSRAFIERQLFKGHLIEGPLTDTELQDIKRNYANRFGVSEKDAEYFYLEHDISSNTYSVKDDSIDILYHDGTIKDIAKASDMLNITMLTRKANKHYIYLFV